MPRYTFDFDLDSWIQGVKIDAESYEEAKNKLCSMSFQDLIDEGYIKDFSIKDLDCEVEEEDYE